MKEGGRVRPPQGYHAERLKRNTAIVRLSVNPKEKPGNGICAQ